MTSKVTVCDPSFGAPSLIEVAQPVIVRPPASSSSVTSAPLVKVGGSLTGVIVMVTEPMSVPPLPSLTV